MGSTEPDFLRGCTFLQNIAYAFTTRTTAGKDTARSEISKPVGYCWQSLLRSDKSSLSGCGEG